MCIAAFISLIMELSMCAGELESMEAILESPFLIPPNNLNYINLDFEISLGLHTLPLMSWHDQQSNILITGIINLGDLLFPIMY